MSNNKKQASKGTLARVLEYLGRYKGLLALSMLLAVATVAATLYVPLLAGRAIDLIVGPDEVDFEGIAALLLETGVIVAFTSLAQWAMNAINNRMTFGVVRDVRRDAFRKIEILPLSYIDTHPTGSIVSRVIADADQFSDGLLLGATQLLSGVATIIGTLCFMISINWKIALLVVVLTPLSLFAAKFISRRSYSLFKTQSETRAEQTALIDEMIEGQKVVQAFGYGERSRARFDDVNERLGKASLSATFFSSLVNPCTRFVNSIVYACVAFAGAMAALGTGFFATGAVFTVGSLSTLLSYANQYTKPFNEISGVVTELQNALACAARVFELIDETPQIPDADPAEELGAVDGRVDINDVSFSYVPERPLIEGLNLAVKPGERVAIVGPTGCGKTTIINLLMRFYDVNGGGIAVEGHDIRGIRRRDLRHSYGMVLQETWLRSGTIRDNIAMGRPDATDEEIIAAAKSAHADSFIRRLPDGYDTVIGEDGGSLSQGQKQLLCIARVMLCAPPMLILDEATSSIDTRTELKIQNAFNTMMKGRTSFIVAHRLSTIRNADLILVMRDGHIIEQGNHTELLQKGGFYSELYNSQFDNTAAQKQA